METSTRHGVVLATTSPASETSDELKLAARPELRSFDEVLRNENVRRISIIENANAILTISHQNNHELIRIWDLESKLLTRAYRTNVGVGCFNLSPDGNKLLLGAADEVVSLDIEPIFGGRRLTESGAYRLPNRSAPINAVIFGADSGTFRAITTTGEQHQISFRHFEPIKTKLKLESLGQ